MGDKSTFLSQAKKGIEPHQSLGLALLAQELFCSPGTSDKCFKIPVGDSKVS